ncbi:MAG: YggS family pyridoxal phosphate-dependent enzyme [Acidobacteria bacterium]|nr:YggS family pyridoxal phosphate-dependent enzyme [Acidobacteriota bacterium]
MSVGENIEKIRGQMAEAARKAGRRADAISLMAVTKTFGPELIRQAYDAGLRLFGENRVQEFQSKLGQLEDMSNAEWHMIGHLQGNKTNKAAELFSCVDSVDSLRVAERLNRAGGERGKRLKVLLEINVGEEAAKSGLRPDAQELWQILASAAEWPHLEIEGLMTVPPFLNHPEAARPHFRRLRQLRDLIRARNLQAVSMEVLSMGMSHDFEVAIEEGSTRVRLGTAIFGAREARAV